MRAKFEDRRAPAEWFYYEQSVKDRAIELALRKADLSSAKLALEHYCKCCPRLWTKELLNIAMQEFNRLKEM
jgi:hypothetical protein